jgi:polysaccharide deacetylase family protein (PEP-CTERM system associated)
MFNFLTIDIEDYFQVHAFSNVIKFEDWENYECRIERNTDRLLEILNSVHSPHPLKQQHRSTSAPNNSQFITQNSPKGSFFVLGWIAERFPDLIRRIKAEGHEIACHGYAHQLIYKHSKEEFRKDIRKAKSILEDITGDEVIGYRAPSYSITNNSKWAFKVLVEEGFKYDSSIFPIRHDFYGIPNAPRFPFIISLNGNSSCEFSMLNFESKAAAPQYRNTAALINNSTFKTQNSKLKIDSRRPQSSVLQANSTFITQNSKFIFEFPISTVQLLGMNLPISGGGYFRLFPYPLIKKGLKRINEKEQRPFIFYIHPWEIDPEQPRINGLSSRSKFRHYVNLDKTELKFRRLLGDFQFSTIKQLLGFNSSTASPIKF